MTATAPRPNRGQLSPSRRGRRTLARWQPRPAIEDLWGAGALIDSLSTAGRRDVSPEGRAASAAYQAVVHELSSALSRCASGRELIEAGYADDVHIAGELDSIRSVPLLQRNAFNRI